MVGDGQTAALVALDGSIDFLCLPRFDSPGVFLRLLDAAQGGAFDVVPALTGRRISQRYVRDTNVLITRLAGAEGTVEIRDFMPMERVPGAPRLVRRVSGRRGRVSLRVRCAVRFDYARTVPRIELHGSRATLREPAGPLALRLRSPVPLHRDGDDVVAHLALCPGEHATFVLELVAGGARLSDPEPRPAATGVRSTLRFWREWISQCTYDGPWRDAVRRSALVLKLLQYRPTGALVAAPTFGLPEQVGGARNWDFRYAWIRDAAFAAYALQRLGFREEMAAFIQFAASRCEQSAAPGELQPMYRVDGSTDLAEHTLDHLAGHRGSRPVRVGNGAYDQLQLDIYGELIDALYASDEHGAPATAALWRHVTTLTEWVCRNWERPDQGIWEVRAGCRHFLYSRVMCWVAVDRAIRMAERRSRPAPLSRWREVRQAIRHDVEERFWSEREQCFVGERDSHALDASCLVMPLVQFIAPEDPRWRCTMRALERHLVQDGLVRRYAMPGMDTDAAAPTQPFFTICSFWYIECLARAGETRRAAELFAKLLGHANHLGLFSEDIGRDGELRGNFPQGLTHLALIGAALALPGEHAAG